MTTVMSSLCDPGNVEKGTAHGRAAEGHCQSQRRFAALVLACGHRVEQVEKVPLVVAAAAHRNRIAAQNSRDKRKAQYTAMERRIAELKEENRLLRAGTHISDTKQRTDDRRQEEELDHEKARERESTELKERIKSLEKGWEAVMKVLAIKGFRHPPHLLLLAIHRTHRRLPLIRRRFSPSSSPLRRSFTRHRYFHHPLA
ncbi:hypothetical protein DFH11DRAFT_1648321, partial [Phellopilus nigrolimitatus]